MAFDKKDIVTADQNNLQVNFTSKFLHPTLNPITKH